MVSESLVILHTNDFHGCLTVSKATQLKSFRQRADLYFDCGDGIKAGNLGIPLRPDPYWNLMSELECTASTLGNRESHIIEHGFQAKLAGHSHPIVCANVRHKVNGHLFPGSILIEKKGIQIGVIGGMVPMVTENMTSQVASSYLWDPPISTICEEAKKISSKTDLLVALTHIGFPQDRKLAESCPELDLIMGGHSHTVLEKPVQVGKTWICQAGSHGHFVGHMVWDKATRTILYELLPLI